MSPTEQRRYPRLNIALDVAFGPAENQQPPHESQLKHTITVNISAGGMCLYTDTLYPVGAQLYCAVAVPGCPNPLEVLGVVAWFQRVQQETRGYKVGVEFSKITEEDRALLDRLVREPPSSHIAQAKKLLLVDDDAELIEALKVRFESAGFTVVTAAEGLEAIQKSRAEQPNLIILDLILPKLSGYEVCRLLKFDPKFHHIPIILLTARSRQEDKAMGSAVGADAYLTKPFDGKTLLAKVDELLANGPT